MSSISQPLHLFTPSVPFSNTVQVRQKFRPLEPPCIGSDRTRIKHSQSAYRSSSIEFSTLLPSSSFSFLTRFCLYRFDILNHLTKWDEFSSREGLVFVLYRFRAPFFRDLETKNRKKMTDYNSDVRQKPFFSVLFHS